jgi:hypothetical protein
LRNDALVLQPHLSKLNRTALHGIATHDAATYIACLSQSVEN